MFAINIPTSCTVPGCVVMVYSKYSHVEDKHTFHSYTQHDGKSALLYGEGCECIGQFNDKRLYSCSHSLNKGVW